MTLPVINALDFKPEICRLWLDQWLLLCCGNFEKNDFNMMTVAWGSFGVMWNRPFAQVVVRPSRHTLQFMERYPDFTLTAFPNEYRQTLQMLGSTSGRDMDKKAKSGLTPIACATVDSPAFEEAELIVECRKIYRDQMTPQKFLDPAIEEKYPEKDYHVIYFGEITAAAGIETYSGGASL